MSETITMTKRCHGGDHAQEVQYFACFMSMVPTCASSEIVNCLKALKKLVLNLVFRRMLTYPKIIHQLNHILDYYLVTMCHPLEYFLNDL